MTPRRAFTLGVLVGVSFAAGVLVDAAVDVTGWVAVALAPVERWLYPLRAATFGVIPGSPSRTYFFDNGHAYEVPRLGPCTGTLPDLAGGS